MDSHNANQQEPEPLPFIRGLLDGNAVIAGDVVEISAGTWAIHGIVPVDGGVLVAEFDSYDGARRTLDVLAGDPGSDLA